MMTRVIDNYTTYNRHHETYHNRNTANKKESHDNSSNKRAGAKRRAGTVKPEC